MKYLTRQNKLIHEIVVEHGHITAEEVFAIAQKSLPKIAVGTVYRNLNELVEAGMIRRIVVPDAPDRFDRTVAPHEHVICPDCGAIADLCVDGLEDVLTKAMDGNDFQYCLTMNARCERCRDKGAEPA